MDERNSIKQRLLAVLDYDGIPQRKRAAHLAAACGCSPSTARRWLAADEGADKMIMRSMFDLARGLDVDWHWLWDGEGATLAPRTLRINLQQVKSYPRHEVDRMMRLFVAWYAGQRKAVCLFDLVMANKLTLHTAARLM